MARFTPPETGASTQAMPSVSSVAASERVTLARNDGYWDPAKKAKVDQVVLLPIPEANTRLAALRSGRVDWIEVPPPDGIPSLKQAGFVISTGSYPHVWPWLLNMAAKDSPLRLVLKYGKIFFIPPAKVELAETWSAQFGSFGVFASRLIPVVRHLIGIPAGIVRMSFWRYSLYTLIGSAIWSAVLTWVGVQAGKDEALMNGELHRLTIWLVGALVVLGAIYWFFVHRHLKAARKKTQA